MDITMLDVTTLNLLVGVLVTLLTGVFAKFCLPAKDEMDKKIRASIIIAVAFIITVVIVAGYYVALQKNIISVEFIERALTVLFTGVGAFEVVLKQVIRPAMIRAGIWTEEN